MSRGNPTFLNIDPAQMRQEMEQLGYAWADRNAAATLFEEAEKSVLAEIESDYRKQFKTAKEAESLAKADTRYKEHLKAMVEARRLSNRARVAFDACKAQFELIRTQAATERAAMSMR